MGVEESSLDHEELATDAEAEVVAGFLQAVFDYGEMWSEYEPAQRVRAQYELGQLVTEMRKHGWRVFGARGQGMLVGHDGEASPWHTAYVRVVRADSEAIFRLGADPAVPQTEPHGTFRRRRP